MVLLSTVEHYAAFRFLRGKIFRIANQGYCALDPFEESGAGVDGNLVNNSAPIFISSKKKLSIFFRFHCFDHKFHHGFYLNRHVIPGLHIIQLSEAVLAGCCHDVGAGAQHLIPFVD